MSPNLFGWSEAVWRLIDQVGMLFGVTMGLTWFGGLLFAILKPDTLKRWFTRNRFPNVGDGLAEGERWDGLVFTVSKAELPILVLRRLKPEYVGLIASEQSRSHAETILREAEALGIRSHGLVRVDNPDDPAEARERTHNLLHRMRAAGAARCAVDITGGKTPMSLGAFMAAEEAGVSTLYLASRYDDKLQRPDPHSSRLHCISRPE
jgi:hypothetical protein